MPSPEPPPGASPETKREAPSEPSSLRASLDRWIGEARPLLSRAETRARVESVGTVERIGDGVATVSGLPDARQGELLVLTGGVLALATVLERDHIGCVLLGEGEGVLAGSPAHGTGEVARVPVGEALLGRVVDVVGRPLDGGPEIEARALWPIERPAPAIVDRALVDRPLHTGTTVIDAAIPIGRGQRELIIGDRKTGKTAIAVDTMLSQKGGDVVSVYCAIGQKGSSVEQVIEAVRVHGDLSRCVFVVARADAPPGHQWLAPYAACTIAEYFRDNGQDALLILDDLTKHAIVYRQLSLLLRNPPGREAYPGDIFYIHSRLLERAANLAAGGSLTALPIAETQGQDLAAYIPTNLISITDGQICLEPRLFYEGQKPAVNVGMSVSRVGGKTQAPAMKDVAKSLRLEYAQYLELEVFTRFGGMVDAHTQKLIDRGRRVRAVLAQPKLAPLPSSLQVAMLLALGEGLLDAVPVPRIAVMRERLRSALGERVGGVLARIDAGGELSGEDRAALLSALRAFVAEQAVPAAAQSEEAAGGAG